MKGMHLRVVGGTALDGEGLPTPEAVDREARRRLEQSAYGQLRARMLAGSTVVPADIRHYVLQLEFAAAALKRLSPLPADFRADSYWPKKAERSRTDDRHQSA